VVMEQQLTAFIYPLIMFLILGVIVPVWLSNVADTANYKD